MSASTAIWTSLTALALLATLAPGIAQAENKDDDGKASLKVYAFECGQITVSNVSMFSPGHDEGQSKELTDSCFLVRHAKGTLMWDTGLSDALAAEPNGVTAGGGLFQLKVKKTLASQLEEAGIEPAEVDYLAMSHLHSDHTGNAALFAGATWIVQRPEHDAAFGPEPARYRFDPASYAALQDGKTMVIDGDYDVFGDGSVVILAAPGHTPGHQVLFLDLAKNGPVVLSGDLFHFTKNRAYARVPAFNFDRAESLRSIDRVEGLIARTKATMWIQHDKEQMATIAHAPVFVE